MSIWVRKRGKRAVIARTRDVERRARLDTAGIGSDAVSKCKLIGEFRGSRREGPEAYCLGAVVFTCDGKHCQRHERR